MKQEIMDAYWAGYKEGQYSGDKTAEEYYNEVHKGEVSPQDTTICNYPELKSISGYTKEQEDTEEYKAYRRGWLNRYDEDLYDKNNK